MATAVSALCMFCLALLGVLSNNNSNTTTVGRSFLRRLQSSIADDALDAINDAFADGDIPGDDTRDEYGDTIVGIEFIPIEDLDDPEQFPTIPPTITPTIRERGNSDDGLETWALALIIAGGGVLVLALIAVAYYNLRKAEKEQEVNDEEGEGDGKRGVPTQGMGDDSDEMEEEVIEEEDDIDVPAGNTEYATNDYDDGAGYRSSGTDGLGQFQASTPVDPDASHGDDDSGKVSM
jgi:hypothetical protein